MARKKKSEAKAGKEKDCFVIAAVGEEGSETRVRTDKVYKHIVEPAVVACGYKPIRADKLSEPGIITTQIIQHIANDSMMVADLTERNPNVFYELALRHAIKKPVIQIIDKSEKIPFDVASSRFIQFDYTDLDSVADAKREIESQIRKAEMPSFKAENPISVVQELKSLQMSENPESKSMADLLSILQEIQRSVTSCERRLSNPLEIFPPGYFEGLMERSSRVRLDPRAISEFHDTIERLTELYEREKPSREIKEEINELRGRLRKIYHYLGRRM